jgi:hypothetical protein
VQLVDPEKYSNKSIPSSSKWKHKHVFPDFSPYLVKSPLSCKLFVVVASTLSNLQTLFIQVRKVKAFISNFKEIYSTFLSIEKWNEDLMHDLYYDDFEEQRYKTFFKNVIGILFIPSLQKLLEIDRNGATDKFIEIYYTVDPVIHNLYETYHIQHLFIFEIQNKVNKVSYLNKVYKINVVRYMCRPCHHDHYILEIYYNWIKWDYLNSIILTRQKVLNIIESKRLDGDGQVNFGSPYHL